MRTLLAVAVAGWICGQSTLAAAQDCSIPVGVNPYYSTPPPGCVGFNPYDLPPVGAPLQTGAGAAVFLFTGGAINPETLAYLDLVNASSAPQRVDLEVQLADKILKRRYLLLPKRPVSIDLGADPELQGATVTFSLQVTFERLGSATLTMRPSASPWSSAITPTPRIVDLVAR